MPNYPFPHTIQRPLSWSALSSFTYDPEQWFNNYVLGKKDPPNKEMIFGKLIGEKLASDPTYLPEVPRLDKYEHELRVMFMGTPLVGYMDNYCTKTKKKMHEFKTGKKAWDAKRVREHGQLDMYLLMHYITEKIPPEEMDVSLVWLPTRETGAFEIEFVEPFAPKIFKAKRTMQDLLTFGARINETVKEMKKYCQEHA